GKPRKRAGGDLSKLSVGELVALHSDTNEWFVRQARLQLAERDLNDQEKSQATQMLRDMIAKQADPVLQVRAMCSMFALGGADDAFLISQLENANEHIRVWAIRMLTDDWALDTIQSERPRRAAAHVDTALLNRFVGMAKSDSSKLVQLALATA